MFSLAPMLPMCESAKL